jgi:RNA polymerase primary sigma factor/RNA polymerase sigma factor
MHTDYKSPVIRQLRDQQVRFAPREQKVQQLNRAEVLLGEIDPRRTYTYAYLCYRITDFRPESFPNFTLRGEEAVHDLQRFVEDLSESAHLEATQAGEPVLTLDDFSKRFKVSMKTIARWRRRGLVGRRFLFEGRKRVGFLQSSVERFVEQNQQLVERSSRFSQLTAEEREHIVQRARRLAHAGGCQSDVARRIARRTGRSVETIRSTLRQFDRENPAMAIFPESGGQLSPEAKKKVFQLYRRGTTVDALTSRFQRTKTTIYRVINELRAQRILELPLDYIPHPRFARKDADQVCLSSLPEGDGPLRKIRRPGGLPPYLASLYEIPLLTPEQEQHIFRKFNYLKYKASKLRDKLDPINPKAAPMDEIEQLYEQAVATKNEIVRANLRLVVSIAKRHVGQHENFFELVSDGNMSLLRAVEKFDFSRGNKFSTYASWAIMKNFARTIPGEFKHRDRYRTSLDELFAATEETRGDPVEQVSAQLEREGKVERMLRRLDEREQKIIIHRFGLDHAHEPQTLKEVGASMGVTKERVRQLEARALHKLRLAAEEEKISADFD